MFYKQLKNLPEKFHPITICLHHCDIETGKLLPYIKKGFHVVPAGNKFNKDVFALIQKYCSQIIGRKEINRIDCFNVKED